MIRVATERDQVDQKAMELMEEADSHSRTRVYSGWMNMVVSVILVGFALFQLWANLTGTLGAVKLRAEHIMLLLPLAFMLYPTYRKERRKRRMMPVWDILLCVTAVACFAYILSRYDALTKTGRLNDTDVWVGIVCLAVSFEAARRKLQQNTVNCTASFTQHAAITALDCVQETEAMRLSYLERRDLICDGLNAIPGIECPRAEGAFYAFFRVSYDGMSAEELADLILEKAGILVVPGTAFGEGGENCIRMSFAADRASLCEAVRRLSLLFV